MQLELNRKNFLPHQFEFLIAQDPILALVSGFGAGKTHVFLRKVLIHHIYNRRTTDGLSSGWVLYPTLDLANELFVEDFKLLLDDLDIDFEYNAQLGRFKSKYGYIKVYTLEQPNRLVGSNLTFVGIDEFDTSKKALQCYTKAIGRLRGCLNPQIFIVTTPEGFKATYKIFVENAKPSQRIIHARTLDNPYLPENYIKLLEEQYDPKLLKAYMDGLFVNLTSGSVYYAFDREKHVVKEELGITPGIPLNICFDFNVYPYSVSWNQQLNSENIRFLGEWVSKSHSNTEEACLEITKILPDYLDVVIYGDASGRSGAANSTATNYQIIDKIFKNYFKSVNYKVPKSNGAIKDRINCVNSKISKNHVLFNPSCVKLIQDLEQVVWNSNGTELDKANIERTHSSDGAGYFFTVEHPIIDFRQTIKTKSL
jgi:hypothetical protein